MTLDYFIYIASHTAIFANYTFVLCRDTARRVRIRRVHINDCINKSSIFFADYTFVLCRDTARRVPTTQSHKPRRKRLFFCGHGVPCPYKRTT